MIAPLASLCQHLQRGLEATELDATARASLPGSFVELADGQVHYELAGPGEGQVVVLVHGFSLPLFIWERNVEPLVQAGFRVLRYDLYGRGFSARPRTRYGLELFDRQLAQLLEALALTRPVHLVGLSMGGAIVARFVTAHAAAVGKAAFIAPLGANRVVPAVFHVAKAPLLAELLYAMVTPTQLLSHAMTSPTAELAERLALGMRFRGHQRAALSTTRHLELGLLPSLYQELGRMRLPVALFWGLEDRVLPYAAAADFLRAVPRATFHPSVGGSHCPNYEDPEVLNPRLVEFLSQAPCAARG